ATKGKPVLSIPASEVGGGGYSGLKKSAACDHVGSVDADGANARLKARVGHPRTQSVPGAPIPAGNGVRRGTARVVEDTADVQVPAAESRGENRTVEADTQGTPISAAPSRNIIRRKPVHLGEFPADIDVALRIHRKSPHRESLWVGSIFDPVPQRVPFRSVPPGNPVRRQATGRSEGSPCVNLTV